jgi:hypothetical protein
MRLYWMCAFQSHAHMLKDALRSRRHTYSRRRQTSHCACWRCRPAWVMSLLSWPTEREATAQHCLYNLKSHPTEHASAHDLARYWLPPQLAASIPVGYTHVQSLHTLLRKDEAHESLLCFGNVIHPASPAAQAVMPAQYPVQLGLVMAQ